MIQEDTPKSSFADTAAAPAAASDADDDDDDDILQEADVYIVYGLHEQAEVELKKAIEKQPDNLEYRAKLLENYHASDNKEAFEAEATEFSKLNGPGKAELWQKVSGWGSKLLPASPLFAGPGVAAAISTAQKPVENVIDTPVVDAPAFENPVIELPESDDSSSGLMGKLGMAGAAAAAGGVAITAGKAFADNAQDKLGDTVSSAKDSAGSALSGLTDKVPDLGDVTDKIPGLDDVTDKIPGLGEVADLEAPESAEVLDFDDMDLDSLLSADAKVEVPDAPSIDTPDLDDVDLDFAIQDMDVSADTKDLDVSDADSEMDFDFSEFEIDEPAASNEKTTTSVLDGKVDELDGLDDFSSLGFDLDDKEEVKLGSTNLNLALDGSNTGVGKILPENSVYKIAEAKDAKDDILGDMDDDLSFLDLDDGADTGLMDAQVSTKLDLARAYMDMGDVEGARSTLEEVMAEGNADQKKEAKELLVQTG